ncbi:hypothetical protein, partial [Brevundimonas sp. EYE_349]|uniref:hypothetical protein n=1 Tax=Brevundimonas sp. EYE_349 TaxID=2853455 RepID=UPI002002C7B1
SIEQGRLIDPPLAHHHAASGLNDQSESAPEARGNCRLFQRYRWLADFWHQHRNQNLDALSDENAGSNNYGG